MNLGFEAQDQQEQWYAAWTRSRHEKSVQEHLRSSHIECFLPLYQSVRRWKDRRVQLNLPLFPGYLFVRLDLHDRLKVLTVPGVVGLIARQGQPAPVPVEEINGVRAALGEGLQVRPHPYLAAGRRVRVNNGAFAGTTGILLRTRNNYRVVLSIELIKRAVCVEVDIADLELL